MNKRISIMGSVNSVKQRRLQFEALKWVAHIPRQVSEINDGKWTMAGDALGMLKSMLKNHRGV